MTNEPTFEPTEIWKPQAESFHLEESIEAARRQMNGEDPKQLIHELKNEVKRSDNGIVYAVLKGNHPEEYSDSDALVMFNPFANTATANMLVRAEFIRRVAEQANVRDEQGKLKPVVMLASPGIFGSHLNLKPEEKKSIKGGDLGPAAKEYLRAVSCKDYGRIALLGFSQGGDMVAAAANAAGSSNIDAPVVVAGEPAGNKDRKLAELGADFLKSSGQFQSTVLQSDVLAQQKAIGRSPLSFTRNKDFMRFGLTALASSNRLLWSAMSHDNFEREVDEALRSGKVDKYVIGYGTDGKLAEPDVLEPSLSRLRRQVKDSQTELITVKVQGNDHAWGDNLPLLAKLYLLGIS